MGLIDKAKNAAEKATGQAKEKLGDAKGDEELKADGQSDQVAGSAKQAGENVKDVFK